MGESRQYSGLLIVMFLAAIFVFTLSGCSKNNNIVIVEDATPENTPENTQIPATSESDPSEPVPVMAAACGNNKLESGEECDGDVPKDVTCQSNGYDEGIVSCTSKCEFDFSACITNITIVKTVSSGACTDTDDGLDYATKGTVTVKGTDSSKTYTDYCRHGSSEGQLFEYHCENDEVASLSYECPKGCNNNGACY